MKIPNLEAWLRVRLVSLARIVSEDSQLSHVLLYTRVKSSKDS